MSSFYREYYDKDVAFINFFFQVHPDYMDYSIKQRKNLRKMAASGHLNTELMMEELVSLLNPNFVRSNEPGMDYRLRHRPGKTADFKTSSCSKRVKKAGAKPFYEGAISSVQGKKGDLLVAIYNEFRTCIEFFRIPHSAYTGKNPEVKVTKRGQIKYSFSTRCGNLRYTNNLELYRRSFGEIIDSRDPALDILEG
jgi:hypothetical protein